MSIKQHIKQLKKDLYNKQFNKNYNILLARLRLIQRLKEGVKKNE